MWIIKNSRLIIFLFILGLALSIIPICGLKIIPGLSNFVPQNNPEVQFYNNHSNIFGSTSNVLLIAVESNKSIYNREFLDTIKTFTKKCKSLSDINQAESIATTKELQLTAFGLQPSYVIPWNKEVWSEVDSISIVNDPRIYQWLVSKDFKSINVVLNAKQNLSNKEKNELIFQIDSLIETFKFYKSHVIGEVNTEVIYTRLLKKATFMGTTLTSIVIILLLSFIYRSRMGVFLPLLSVLMGMTYLYAFLGLTSRSINVLSSLFPSIVMIVGISDIIHFYSRYNDNLIKQNDNKSALILTIKELTFVLFLTSFTTMIGFGLISTSAIEPFKAFGLDTVIAVINGFAIAIIFIPPFLHLVKPRRDSLKIKIKIGLLLSSLNNQIQIHYKSIIIVAGIVLFLSFYGISKISSNSLLFSNISSKTKLRKDYSFFENELSGIRTLEFSILPQNRHRIDEWLVLNQIEKFHVYLESFEHVGSVFSPVILVKSIHKAKMGGEWNYYKLPEPKDFIFYKTDFNKLLNNRNFENILSIDENRGRILIRMKDQGRTNVKEFNESLLLWVNENLDINIVHFQITGSDYVSDIGASQMISNMFYGLLVAIAVIAIIMSFLFKNFNMILISLIPNLFPLVVVGAILGFFHIKLDGAIAIIFTIGFVIAVDDTIHFLSKFKLVRKNQIDLKSAIHITLQETGNPIIITSLILFFGYGILMFSPFREIYYMGLLLSTTVIIALISDLVILPALMYLLLDKNKKV